MVSGTRRSPVGLLLAVTLVGVLLWTLGRGARTSAQAGAPSDESCAGEARADGSCPGDGNVLGGPSGTDNGERRATVLDGSRICPGAGYLCHGLQERSDRRVVRWNEGTPEIRIRIPRPAGEAPDVALQLQQAAQRGVNVWNGHPFTLRVVLSDRPAGEDFAVRWGGQLGGLELGRVETRWTLQNGLATIQVREFALATRSPHWRDQTLDPAQVTLTAAHEMGHALGLPHSDSERDVMYPTNTSSSLSTRDFRTMEALYSLENGAEIRTGG